MTDTDGTPKRLGTKVNRNAAFDLTFGARIRAARIAAGMSQGALGERVGVSFQQVQKYELGKDRVSASMVAAIAQALDVHPGSFFDDDPTMPAHWLAPRSRSAQLRDAQRLGEQILRLRTPTVVRRLMALVDVLVNAQEGRSST